MNAPAAEAGIRRILVVLDASVASRAALASAARFAARLEAELLGVFVEDVNLLRFAGFPFARERSHAAGLARALDTRDMERALRVCARAAREALEQVAARERVPWSFRVTRGPVIELLLAAAAEADMVAIGCTGRGAGPSFGAGAIAMAVAMGVTQPILLTPPGGELRAPVAVAWDDSPSGARALELAVQISREYAAPVTVLLAREADEADARLREEIAVRLTAAGVARRLRVVRRLDLPGMAEALRREPVGTLVLPMNLLPGDLPDLQDLVEDARAAVLLVR